MSGVGVELSWLWVGVVVGVVAGCRAVKGVLLEICAVESSRVREGIYPTYLELFEYERSCQWMSSIFSDAGT